MMRANSDTLSQKRNPENGIELLSILSKTGLQFPPTEINLVSNQVLTPLSQRVYNYGDGVAEVTYRGNKQQYVYDLKLRSTPQVLQNSIKRAQDFATSLNQRPLIIAPYLSEEALKSLEEAGISGVDLSGNGIIMAPDFTIRRTGSPNLYPETQKVRNLYRGTSALFVRCFLLRAEHDSLKSLREYALSRLNPTASSWNYENKLTMGTASKVIQQMIEERIVERDGHRLRATAPEKLMEGLRNHYRPSEGARITGKTTLLLEEVWGRMANHQHSTAPHWRYAATGLSSAVHYHVLSGMDIISLYVTDLNSAAKLIDLRSTRIFPNIELIEDQSDALYFDTGANRPYAWASPIQTWLELSTNGPREREASESLAPALKQGKGEIIR